MAVVRAKSSNQNVRAFTLLELLIVLAIMTAVLGLTWPQVARYVRKAEVREACLELQEAIADARSEAMATGEVWMIHYRIGGSSFEVLPVAQSKNLDQTSMSIGPGKEVRIGDSKSSESFEDSQNSRASKQSKANGNNSEPGVDSSRYRFELDGVEFHEQPLSEVDDESVADSLKEDQFETTEIGSPGFTEELQYGSPIFVFPDGRILGREFWLASSVSDWSVKIEFRDLTGKVIVNPVRRIRMESTTRDGVDSESSSEDFNDEFE